MGDLSFYPLLVGMASAKHPVLQAADAHGWRLGEDGPALQKWTDSLVIPTDAVRKMLEGHSDYVKLNGLDRWIGGVHLTGAQVARRWDRAASKIIGPKR